MLRPCKGADLSRDAGGPPDQLPFSEAAPAAVLQASVRDMPATCNMVSNHELIQRPHLCIDVSALMAVITYSLRFVTDLHDRCQSHGTNMWFNQCNATSIFCWHGDSNNSRVGSLHSQITHVFCRHEPGSCVCVTLPYRHVYISTTYLQQRQMQQRTNSQRMPTNHDTAGMVGRA